VPHTTALPAAALRPRAKVTWWCIQKLYTYTIGPYQQGRGVRGRLVARPFLKVLAPQGGDGVTQGADYMTWWYIQKPCQTNRKEPYQQGRGVGGRLVAGRPVIVLAPQGGEGVAQEAHGGPLGRHVAGRHQVKRNKRPGLVQPLHRHVLCRYDVRPRGGISGGDQEGEMVMMIMTALMRAGMIAPVCSGRAAATALTIALSTEYCSSLAMDAQLLYTTPGHVCEA
jgi:hypothetical protein